MAYMSTSNMEDKLRVRGNPKDGITLYGIHTYITFPKEEALEVAQRIEFLLREEGER